MKERELSAFKERRSRLLAAAREAGCDCALLTSSANVAWLTGGGRMYVNVAQDAAVAQILVAKSGCTLFCNNIEAPRLAQEELKAEMGIQILDHPWPQDPYENVRKRVQNRPVICDAPAPLENVRCNPAAIQAAHFPLTEPEANCYRQLGKEAAQALEKAAGSLKAGATEFAAAARIALECHKRGMEPVVNLVAFDARLEAFRHPLPTARELKKTGMLVLCARRGGLIANCTRMVSVGAPSANLKNRHAAVCAVDAAFNGATRAGAKIAEIFEAGLAAYKETGYGDEWKKHHQGGATGYKSRYFIASKKSAGEAQVGSAWAWNPSITGTKHENTFLLTETGMERITQTGKWPVLKIKANGQNWEQDDILVLKK